MTALIINVIATLVIASICGLFCHYFIKNYWPANIATVVYTLLTYHVLAFIEAGYLDPYWMISSIIVAGVAMPVAIVIGTLMKERKKAG